MNFARATTLIIATYNWPEALHCCLISVAGQKVLPSEIIIADDGSDDRTRDLIDHWRLQLPVPLIHVWQEDFGFRKSLIMNKAVTQSSGKYIIQIDGDVILHPAFVKDHISVAEPSTFIRGTRARLNSSKTSSVLHSQNTDLHFYTRGVYNRINGIRPILFWNFGKRKEMNSRNVRGSNLSYWKSDFLRVNGYNNDLNGWGHEDEELAARFINNRIIKKIVKLRAIQFHLHHQELPKPNEPLHRQIVEQTILANHKHCLNGYENLV